jgi:hypothetical protein
MLLAAPLPIAIALFAWLVEPANVPIATAFTPCEYAAALKPIATD